MKYQEFMNEFNNRVGNRYLYTVYQIRSKMTPREVFELSQFPMGVLQSTYMAGADAGIKTLAEMSKEGKTIEVERKE